jgi:Thaumatin family
MCLLTINDPAAQTYANRVSLTNSCPFTVWVTSLNNSGSAPLRPSDRLVRLNSGQSHAYGIPDGGWGGQFRPKFQCDANGNNCLSGQSLPPCPTGPAPYAGCQPPAETKIEFHFPFPGEPVQLPFFDTSLVDGYTLRARIAPDAAPSGNCTTFNCNLSFESCPASESFGLGDLRVVRAGEVVMCLSPCKKWNFPAPYGLGLPETQGIGRELCCADGISPRDCNASRVVQTQYVQSVRANCPSAYSFAYDDLGGTHACPLPTNFAVTFCP